jgi:hypothetical protein
LAILFVGHPERLLLVALLLAASAWILGRSRAGRGRSPRQLLWAAGIWALASAWEGLVLAQTPEADIRVDWLLIVPVLVVSTLWFSFRALRRRIGFAPPEPQSTRNR